MKHGATQYLRWIDSKKFRLLALSLIIFAGCSYISSKLSLRSDFSNLLPPERKSVQDLRALKERIRTFGTIYVLIQGEDAASAQAAVDRIRPQLSKLDPSLVSRIVDDDTQTRAFFWENRFLFVSDADLRKARKHLRQKIDEAKLDANPLFINLEEDEGEESVDEAESKELDELLARLDKAEAAYNEGSGFVSEDGKVHLITLRTTTTSTDFGKTQRLIAALQELARDTEGAIAGTSVGLTGDVISAHYENQSIMRGIWQAALVTGVLIALLLLGYFRAPLAVAASLWSLLVAVAATFALTQVWIGHLNVMSAFLFAIVAGNGINSGLILLARYFEELRSDREHLEALAVALRGAAHGTLTAALSAGIAYGALAVTEFRGFRHFGIIGSVGMVLSWLSAFVFLPAGLCALHSLRKGTTLARKDAPALDRWVSRFSGRSGSTPLLLGLSFAIASAVLSFLFVTGDPFERDWRNLRSESADIDFARNLDRIMRENIGKQGAGLTSRFVVALDDAERVPEAQKILEEAPESLISSVHSLDDLIPPQQERKIAVINELRELIDEALEAGLSKEDEELAQRIRPPETIEAIGWDDVPEELSWPFVEKSGAKGRVLLVGGALHFKAWSVDDRIELADGVRSLGLPKDAVIGGQTFVIADIIRSMLDDGPKASAVAIIGAVLCIFLLVGGGRFAAVTIFAGATGILGMVALCFVFGLRINFLDLVALPITIGIGIDYSVNLATRARQDLREGASKAISSTGGAVVLCSLTTTIGYGSLLLSENAGIRSFGLAAMLGEIACLSAAILLVPPLLARKMARSPTQ